MTHAALAISREDIEAARERISPVVVRTPVVPALAVGERLGRGLDLKLESFQRTGSLKDRGALNRLLALSDEERPRGVVTASAGRSCTPCRVPATSTHRWSSSFCARARRA